MFDSLLDPVPLVEQGRKAAGVDVSLLSPDELVAGVRAVEEARRLLDATEGHLLAELDRQAVCEAEFGLSTAGWLAREAMLPAGVARARVKVAVALSGRLAVVDQALLEGRISWDHARVLTDAANHPRVGDWLTQLAGELIDASAGTIFEIWRRQVTAIIELLDQDGGHDPDDGLARNQLRLSTTLADTIEISGRLVGEHALVAKQAIETKADELFRRFATDHEYCDDIEIPDRACLRALAFVELCRQGQAVDLASTRPPRPDVTLAVNAQTPTTAATDPDGVPLADGSTRVLLCDPDLHPPRHRQPGRAPRHGPHRPIRHPPTAPSPGLARRRLRVPRLRLSGVVDRRPSPHPVHAHRGPDRPREPGRLVPSSSSGHPPAWLADARQPRWLVPLDHTERSHLLEPTPRPPAGGPCAAARVASAQTDDESR